MIWMVGDNLIIAARMGRRRGIVTWCYGFVCHSRIVQTQFLNAGRRLTAIIPETGG